MGLIAMQEPDAAVEELARCVTELGMAGAMLSGTGIKGNLGSKEYWPIYAEAERLGTPICIHGTRSGAQEVGGDRFKTFAEVHSFVFPASVILHFTSVMCNGVLERFPNLKMAFLEIGATWLPFYLDRLDEHWELRGEVEMPYVTKKPTDVFREHEVYVSVEPEETFLSPMIDHLGADHFVFASDVPHWDARFPDNLEFLESRSDLGPDVKQKILYDNGKRLFGL